MTTDEFVRVMRRDSHHAFTDEQESVICRMVERMRADHADEVCKLEVDLFAAEKRVSGLEEAEARSEGLVEEFFNAAGGSKVFGMFETGRDPYKLAIAAVKTMASDLQMFRTISENIRKAIAIGEKDAALARAIDDALQYEGLHSLSDRHNEVIAAFILAREHSWRGYNPPLMTYEEAAAEVFEDADHSDILYCFKRLIEQRDDAFAREKARYGELEKRRAESAALAKEGWEAVDEYYQAAGGDKAFGKADVPGKLAIATIKAVMQDATCTAQLLAFSAFRCEREYQDLKHGTLQEKNQTESGFMLCMKNAAEKAIVAWINDDHEAMMKEIVQAGSVATAMLEQFGVPPGRTPMEMDRAKRRAEARNRK